ncbi:hypothetical protein D3C86_2190580 [compost metagenome]
MGLLVSIGLRADLSPEELVPAVGEQKSRFLPGQRCRLSVFKSLRLCLARIPDFPKYRHRQKGSGSYLGESGHGVGSG